MVKGIEHERLYRALAEKGFGSGGVARAALGDGLGREQVVLLLHRLFDVPIPAAREVVHQAQGEVNTMADYARAVFLGSGRRPRPDHPTPGETRLN